MNKHGQVYIWEILPRPHQSHLFPFVENHIKLHWPMGTEVLLEADVSSAAVLPSVVETKLSLSPWLWVTTKQHNKTWQPLHMGFLISCFSSYGGFKACVSSAANNTVGGVVFLPLIVVATMSMASDSQKAETCDDRASSRKSAFLVSGMSWAQQPQGDLFCRCRWVTSGLLWVMPITVLL